MKRRSASEMAEYNNTNQNNNYNKNKINFNNNNIQEVYQAHRIQSHFMTRLQSGFKTKEGQVALKTNPNFSPDNLFQYKIDYQQERKKEQQNQLRQVGNIALTVNKFKKIVSSYRDRISKYKSDDNNYNGSTEVNDILFLRSNCFTQEQRDIFLQVMSTQKRMTSNIKKIDHQMEAIDGQVSKIKAAQDKVEVIEKKLNMKWDPEINNYTNDYQKHIYKIDYLQADQLRQQTFNQSKLSAKELDNLQNQNNLKIIEKGNYLQNTVAFQGKTQNQMKQISTRESEEQQQHQRVTKQIKENIKTAPNQQQQQKPQIQQQQQSLLFRRPKTSFQRRRFESEASSPEKARQQKNSVDVFLRLYYNYMPYQKSVIKECQINNSNNVSQEGNRNRSQSISTTNNFNINNNYVNNNNEIIRQRKKYYISQHVSNNISLD